MEEKGKHNSVWGGALSLDFCRILAICHGNTELYLLVVWSKLDLTCTFCCKGVVKSDCGSLKIGKVISAFKHFSSLE